MPHPLDSTAVGNWCALALDALGAAREEIDAINVFPVADSDTGTNLHRTLDAAVRALEEADCTSAAEALRTLARGALLGACGNSGTILAQLLRGTAEAVGEETRISGSLLVRALRRAADSAYEAVARPVEGTMLTVASAAADAAGRAEPASGGDVAVVARAAYDGACTALAETPARLEVLRRARVVDAGGEGLVMMLGALVGVPAAARPHPPGDGDRGETRSGAVDTGSDSGPAFEVMYLLDDAGDAEVRELRSELDLLGDSLVIGGGDGLWSVHVHVDDAGAAVEAGVGAGHPHRIRITHLGTEPAPGPVCSPPAATAPADPPDPADTAVRAGPVETHRGRAVVTVVHGDGLAQLCEEAGAIVVRAGADGSVAPELLVEAAASVRSKGVAEVVLLPNDGELHAVAVRAAEDARARGIRAAVIPTRAAVQGIAALAVHEEDRHFDEDVVAMTAAAGATRYGEVAVAEHRSWTTAGVCQAGDVLGLVDGDVAVIGAGVAAVAAEVLERMLAAGGEMVTLVLGERSPAGLGEQLEAQVRRGHLAVDTVVYDGRRQCAPLLIGVE